MNRFRKLPETVRSSDAAGRIAAIGALIALGAAASAYAALIAVGTASHVLGGGA